MYEDEQNEKKQLTIFLQLLLACLSLWGCLCGMAIAKGKILIYFL